MRHSELKGIKMKQIKMILAAAVIAAIAWISPAVAQGIPGQSMVPLGYCQLSASQLASAIGLSKCVRASFTASAGSPSTTLVVTSVSGVIKIGDQIVTGTGLTAGTVITGQISGTPGGAGTYQLSATNTASAATVTSGGIPTGATMAYLEAETADVRYRDDGGVPTGTIGGIIVHGAGGAILYVGTLSALQFILLTAGTPLLNVSFYR